jgi:type VI secretion system FHA domain protein
VPAPEPVPPPQPQAPAAFEERRKAPAAEPAVALAAGPAVRSRIDQWFDLDSVADPWAPGSPLPAALPQASAAVTPGLPALAPPPPPTPQPSPRAAPAAEPPARPVAASETPAARTRRASPTRDDALMRAFLDGAGLAAGTNPSALTVDAAWMRHLGAVLRASTEGTLALLRSRAVTKRSIRAEGTRIVPRENNPLKFAPDATEALTLLIDPQRAYGFLEPVDAVRDAHNDLLVHQLAMVAGMRAAAYELIARMGPDAVAAQHGPATGLARWLPALHEAALWRRHREHHAHVMSHLDDDFEAVFGREFLLAYEAQSRLAAAARAAEAAAGKSV